MKRFEVYIVSLDPTVGSEIQKNRPAAIISPDEMNGHLQTVIVAPMTTTQKPYPSRAACVFQGIDGQIALDQIRAVDKSRLARRMGELSLGEQQAVLEILAEMFAE